MDARRGSGKGYQPNIWPTGLDGPMSRRKLLVSGGGLVLAGGLLAACGGGGSTAGGSGGGGGSITYGYSQPFAEVPVVHTVKSLTKLHAEEKGWSVLLDETKGGEIQGQTSVLDTWITQKINAVTVYPPEPAALEATAQRAIGAGVIWTTYAEKMDQGAGGVLFPGQQFGEIAGAAVVKWINANDPEAEVLILEAPNAVQHERVTVPEEMIEQQTKAKIVAKQVAVDEVKGLQVTEDVLQAHPDVSVVIGFNDDGAVGAAAAFRKQSSKDPSECFILGQDGSETALSLLVEPGAYYNASVALDLSHLTQEVVNFVAKKLTEEWKDGDGQEYVNVAPTLLERDDAKQIEKLLALYKKYSA